MDLQQAHIARLARHIADVLIPVNPEGFTFDPLTFQTLPVFDDKIRPQIYLASIEGYHRRFSVIPSFAKVHGWISDHFEQLSVYGNFIGFWKHAGWFYLDVTKAVYGRNRAVAFGSSNGQQAIFHPYTQEEVPIEYHYDTETTSGSKVCHMASREN